MIAPTLEQIDKIRRKGFRPQVVGCVLNKDKKLLLLFEGKHNLWQLPQGGIENEESLAQALTRELGEELGEAFVGRCSIPRELVLKFDQIAFPPETRESRRLVTDKGEEVSMKGKAYFSCLLHLKGDNRLDIEDTEFDDYIWASYDQAKSLAERIYQRGKRRSTLGVLEVLKEGNLIGR